MIRSPYQTTPNDFVYISWMEKEYAEIMKKFGKIGGIPF